MADDLLRLASDERLVEAFIDRCGIAALEFYRTADSTQRIARDRIASGAAEWTVIAADFQTKGRGQHGRRWTSAPGTSVMFSLVLRPASAEAMALIPVRAGIIIARALEALYGPSMDTRLRLKWPNDLMTERGKLGGILCEGSVRARETTAVLGVGINVFRFPVPRTVDARPAWLADLVQTPVSRLHVFTGILRALRMHLDLERSLLDDAELERFAARDWLSGRRISEPLRGIVIGVTSTGHLVVRKDDGRVEEAVAGTVR